MMRVPSCTVQATPVAPGIAIGRVMILHSVADHGKNTTITPEQVAFELEKFHTALAVTKEQLAELQTRLRKKLYDNEADIFEAHLLLVEDRMMISEVEKGISEELYDAESAVYRAVEKFAAAFSAVEDVYLQERAIDIRDVGHRIAGNMADAGERILAYDEPRIVIAPTLTPSETAGLDREKVLGFAVETGSATSHTAILARSMMLPAVVGFPRELLDSLTVADKLIIDGFSGKVIINPDAGTEEAYRLKNLEAEKLYRQLSGNRDLRAETTDGFAVEIVANVEDGEDYAEIRKNGAGGIGLFRTEFLFMDENNLPDEDEQYEIYKKLMISAGNDPVTIRTLDIGGDKLSSGIFRAAEQNPFLGLRGIRLCLRERRDIFDTQLRALMRAGVHGNMQIMLPMISCMDELLETKEIIAGLKAQLLAEQIPFADSIPLGVMIETPAAAMIADRFAVEADFFSIGSNDLIQYTIAADRSNERVGHLYRPAHPAVLRLIKYTVGEAVKQNIPVAVCGQIAEDMTMVPFLLGLGVNELSMSPGSMPLVKKLVRSFSMHECAELVDKALQCNDSAEVTKLSADMIRRLVPELADI
ncbi:MAG: phosphoenolpyruvate--protein phosphotransferase [Lentisphaeria bacterium]|nr:phosphoenolpyruvate--protein phosphotransferase [Lentisphaeria bacterium]